MQDQANRIHYIFDHAEFFCQLLRSVMKEWVYNFCKDPTKIVKFFASHDHRSVIFRAVEAGNTSLLRFLLFECFEKDEQEDEDPSNNNNNDENNTISKTLQHVALNLENELDLDVVGTTSRRRLPHEENTVRWAAANLKSEACWKVLITGFETFGRQMAQKGREKKQKNRIRSVFKLIPWNRWNLDGKQQQTVLDVSGLTFVFGPAVRLSSNQLNPNSTSPLAHACLHGNHIAVKMLVEFAHSNPNLLNFISTKQVSDVTNIPSFCCLFHRPTNNRIFNNQLECLRILRRNGLDTEFAPLAGHEPHLDDGLIVYFLDHNREGRCAPMFDSGLSQSQRNTVRMNDYLESFMNAAADDKNETWMRDVIELLLFNEPRTGSVISQRRQQQQNLAELETKRVVKNFARIIHGKRAVATVALLLKAIDQHPQSKQFIEQIIKEQILVHPLDIYTPQVTRLLFQEKLLTPELCSWINQTASCSSDINNGKKNLLISLVSGTARPMMHLLSVEGVSRYFNSCGKEKPEQDELERLKIFIELGHCTVEEAFDGHDHETDRRDRSKTGNTLLHFIAIRNSSLETCRTMKYLLHQISCPEKRQQYLNHRNFHNT